MRSLPRYLAVGVLFACIQRPGRAPSRRDAEHGMAETARRDIARFGARVEALRIERE